MIKIKESKKRSRPTDLDNEQNSTEAQTHFKFSSRVKPTEIAIKRKKIMRLHPENESSMPPNLTDTMAEGSNEPNPKPPDQRYS